MSVIADARRFSEDTREILAKLPHERFLRITSAAFAQAIRTTLLSKASALQDLGIFFARKTKQFCSLLYGEACTMLETRGRYLPNLSRRLKDVCWRTAKDLPRMVQGKLAEFRALSLDEKKEMVISGSMWLGAFLLAGGGVDLEGGAPDLDLRYGGLGRHRNLFSHTILLGLFLEFLLRLAVGLFREGKRYLPQEPSPLWEKVEKISAFLEKNENVMISGMWLGLAAHLLKDANLGAERIKPYTGIPFSMSTEAHQAVFAGNSFCSFLLAGTRRQKKKRSNFKA